MHVFDSNDNKNIVDKSTPIPLNANADEEKDPPKQTQGNLDEPDGNNPPVDNDFNNKIKTCFNNWPKNPVVKI